MRSPHQNETLQEFLQGAPQTGFSHQRNDRDQQGQRETGH
jgi:hypothetical protein